MIQLGDFGISKVWVRVTARVTVRVRFWTVQVVLRKRVLVSTSNDNPRSNPNADLKPGPSPKATFCFVGTPYYMSPELFQNKKYNFKSDVWAL
eukprot:963952-Amorphochlora_amoeboformis.AAC.1